MIHKDPNLYKKEHWDLGLLNSLRLGIWTLACPCQ